MSQATLELILDELRNFRSEVNQEFEAVRSEIEAVRSELHQELGAVRSEFKAEIQSVKKDQQTILTRLNSHEKMYAQLIGMVKSVKETVVDIANRQDTLERKFTFQFNTHAASIEVLNREQLMIKTEVEMLKNQY
jgi:septation ring formation regulator EzrA